jgi:hypothetical protein
MAAKLVTFELSGRSVTAAVRKRHRDGTITIEPCSGEWMGKWFRVPVSATTALEFPNIERALQAMRQN